MTKVLAFLFLAIVVVCSARQDCAQTTDFTYQGSLRSAGSPANGNYDLEFKLFDSLSEGTQQGSTIQRLNVPVGNGIFSVSLDFGAGTLSGADRYIEIGLRVNGNPGGFQQMLPRQKINSAPYAVRSLNAATADNVVAGGIPPGSGNYIQNGTSQQASSDFNISGTGTASIFNAATQFNINGGRVISNAGVQNLFAGINSGAANSIGQQNSFFGHFAGSSNSSGGSNSFFGRAAGSSNATGSQNAFFGTNAGETNSGSNNALFGAYAGQFNSTGNDNSFFGRSAGSSNTVGNSNTAFGFLANFGAGDLVNANAIGYRAFVTQSNSLVLGSMNGINGATTSTNVGVGTTAPQKTLHVVGEDIRVEGSSSSISPRFSIVHTGGSGGGTPDRGKWQNYAVYDPFFGGLRFSALNDAENQESIWLNVVRIPGITINRVEFPSGYVAMGNDLLVGTTSVIPTRKLDVRGSAIVLDSSNLGLRVQTNTAGGTVASFGGNGEFRVDAPGVTGGRFTILENGNVGIGTNSPTSKLHVNGTISIVAASGGTQNLCWAVDSQIATCSSSLRYKTNIGQFSQGISFVKKLRPITFDWKDGGMHDVGFGAEDIAEIDPRFVTYNDKGEVEGVKYDRIGVVLVNAVKEQQVEISDQRQLIEVLNLKIKDQQLKIENQQSQIDDLKKIVCSLKPQADGCK